MIGRTVIIMKDYKKGRIANNSKTVTCQPLKAHRQISKKTGS